jgi:hypothetical protein
MDLRNVMTALAMSSIEDWHYIGESPTFRNHIEVFEVAEDEPQVIQVQSHRSTAVYIPDVSITMAWGLTWREDFEEPWVERFPNHQASAEWLDIFFNNALVFRTPYVIVDGGRVTLPLPKYADDDALQVTEGECALLQLIDEMGRGKRPDFASYRLDVKRAGFTVVSTVWPNFPKKKSETRGRRPV